VGVDELCPSKTESALEENNLLEPHSDGLRDQIWWGAGSNATAIWAAKLGMNLQSSTLKNDETGEAFHVQQAAQIRAYRAAWKEAGHAREPRVSVSRSIFALMDDRATSLPPSGGADKVAYHISRSDSARGHQYPAAGAQGLPLLLGWVAKKSANRRLSWQISFPALRVL
jgi:alkanesulfonate monooxygenase SsuD/methylene tetrahydromethanopterin reductase-like flavin-dependent oxidoreductase (luciferase family)